jgi:hypothetical protein
MFAIKPGKERFEGVLVVNGGEYALLVLVIKAIADSAHGSALVARHLDSTNDMTFSIENEPITSKLATR